ncbi:MAG: DUF1559 domain-containing protein [Pirellulaceae bacterium]
MSERNGITLVEVLVILFCIFVLLGLMLPAMVDDRSLSGRYLCLNNLRSIGIATINYETSKDQFPGYLADFGTFTGNTDPGDPDADPNVLVSHRKIGTWAVSLLPYLDQQAVYERWSEDRYPIALSGSKTCPMTSGECGDGYSMLAAPNISVFICPEDETTDLQDGGRNSYVCNAGLHHSSTGGRVSFGQSMSAANGVFNNKFAGLGADGLPVAVGPKVTMEDLKDGLSNTLLVTENIHAMPWHRAGFTNASDLVVPQDASETRYPSSSRYTQGIVWHFEDTQGTSNASAVKPVHRINGVAPGKTLEQMNMTSQNAADLARPSSFHPGVVHSVFADGSTRTLTDSIDYRVYQAILTPRGSESDVPDPSFVLTDEIND